MSSSSDECDSDGDTELLDAVLAAVSELVIENRPKQLKQVLETAREELPHQEQVIGLATAGLLFAIKEKSEGCSRVLMNIGADLEMGDERGDTSLHLAVRAESLNTVKTLLGFGVELHLRNVNGNTALDLACATENMAIMKLIAQFASDELRQGYRRREVFYTALVEAASYCNVRAATVLLNVGADVNSNLDVDTGTALHAACESGSEACVELFLRHHCDVESLRHCALQTPLMRSAECGHVGIVKRLLAAGADINRSTEECSTALTVACHYGHEDIVEVLLEKGASPDTRNRWGYTPLFMAADNPDIVRQLLKKEVEVNQLCGERGEAALHLATVVGSLETLELLLKAGANVNLLTEQSESAIWLSAMKGHDEVTRMLIEYNPRLNDPSNGGEVYAYDYVPLEVALGTKHFEVAKLLILAGASLRNPLYFNKKDKGPWEKLPWLRLRRESLITLQSDEPQSQCVFNLLKNPWSLKELCRFDIRRRITGKFQKKVSRLPIPIELRDYLLMTDLDY